MSCSSRSVCYQDKSHVQAPWTAGLLPNSRPREQLFTYIKLKHTFHPSMSFPSTIPPHLSHFFLPPSVHPHPFPPLFSFSFFPFLQPNPLLSHNDQVTWLDPIGSSLTTQMIGSESSYGHSPSSSSSPREVTLWMGARHQRKEALQIFAREIAPAGTGMG